MNAEKKKIKRLLKEIPEDLRPVANRMITELFFMFDILDSLKKRVDEEGTIVKFVNGSQIMLRQNPALKAYNETMPKFNKLLKDFISLLPNSENFEEADELIGFVNAGI